MTHFSEVDWAAELGIDVTKLHREAPAHPDQLRLHKRITKRAEDYWARERYLAQLGDPSEPVVDAPPPAPEIIRTKRNRVKNYEFTDAQLRIALGSLNASGAV